MESMPQEKLQDFVEKKVPFLGNQEKIVEKIARLERIRNAIGEQLSEIEAKLENFGEENAEKIDFDEYFYIYGEIDFALLVVEKFEDAKLMERTTKLAKVFEKIQFQRHKLFFKKSVQWKSFKNNKD